MTDYNIAYSELTDTYYIIQNGEKVSDCTNRIQSIAEAEQKAMCESCVHKVSADDIDAIRNSAIDDIFNKIDKLAIYYAGDKEGNAITPKMLVKEDVMKIAEQLKE